MNFEHMDQAIAIMKRAEEHNSIAMDFWQRKKVKTAKVVLTEAELHACGNTACFAGHIAVSEEFKKTGGSVCPYNGTPEFDKAAGDEAIALWLGITDEEAESLVFGNLERRDDKLYSAYYDKLWYEVTASDVLVKLHELKEAYENTSEPSEANHV